MATVYLSDFSRVFISIILFSALLNKESRPLLEKEGANPALNVLISFLEIVHLPFSLFLIYLIAGTSLYAGPAIGAMLILSMMLARIILKKAKIIASCNCFGSLAKSDSNRARILDTFLLFCSGIIIIYFFLDIANHSIFTAQKADVFIYGLILLFATVVAYWNSILKTIRQPWGKQSSSVVGSNSGSPEIVTYSEDLVIGANDAGETVSLSDVAKMSSLVMIVGLSSSCHSCNNAKPIFYRLAEIFGEEMTTIFVSDGERDKSIKLNAATQIDGFSEFFSALKITNYPFSVVINTHNFSQVGDISYSSQSVWAMFFRVLSVVIRKS